MAIRLHCKISEVTGHMVMLQPQKNQHAGWVEV